MPRSSVLSRPDEDNDDRSDPVPNPEIREHDGSRELAERQQERDHGRHGIDQSRPTTHVRKSH